MMQCDRNLNESLQKLFLLVRRGAPYVFKNFVRVEELAAVEQSDAVLESG